MKKFKLNYSFALLIVVCVLTEGLILLINYLIALTLHELAHLFVAIKKGYSLKEFKFSMFGVSVELNEQIDDSDSFLINIAGPVINLVLCLICVMLYWCVPKGYNILNLFCISNLTLAVFNLLPIYPLDGGKIFSTLMSEKKYLKLEKCVKIIISVFALVAFIISCFYSINWFLLLIGIVFMLKTDKTKSKDVLFKYSRHKKIDRIELVKASGEETLFELIKKIQTKKYIIFYYKAKTDKYIDEDEIIEMGTKFPLVTKLKEVCKF